ncbi:hypothetical protein F5X68DRAFT_74473 [Plectosphaerella plurivora]|uniref:Zn(2)-C6 fungal-type domain-containing protein n=1 Tax=Plectosphaerella plurivora TaxID=936078 RepID=A0A9P8VG81_9PEZI|nr:hypothetical protein F5X68DRAFT_74473 [Plectosphaerella plurivora]
MSVSLKRESPDPGRGDDFSAFGQPVLKRRRITKACDFCHRRGRKCKIPPDTNPGEAGAIVCLTCIEHGAICTWQRVAAKRGVKTKSSDSSSKTTTSPAGHEAWAYESSRHGERPLIQGLLRVFFDTVYPIFPFFAEALIFEEWEQFSLSTSRSSFARLMSICALSSCHVGDGAIFTLPLSVPVEARHQQAYLEDARRAIPVEVSSADCFAYLQSLGTLSLAAIQLGDASLLHQTLGQYHSLVAQHHFQNESRWPVEIDPVERHVRRQFFWSMYRLEVHSALIMGHSVRCPEMQAAVAYPAISDDMVDALTGSLGSLSGIPFGGWLVGWNYITDLYRVLEHVIVQFRARKLSSVNRGSLYIGFESLAPPVDEILSRVLAQRDALPSYLAIAPPPSADLESNMCGFQVANIACTIQLLRITSFSRQDLTFVNASRAAMDLIEEMSLIPVDYLRAIGSPMLQELAGVGHMLSSFIGRQLHPVDYQRLRRVIEAMALFLTNLGPSLPAAVEAGSKLSQHIGRIDDYLQRSQPQDNSILNEPETTHATHEQGLQVPTQHFVVPNVNFTIPIEYVEHIPWPSPFVTEWTADMGNVFS